MSKRRQAPIYSRTKRGVWISPAEARKALFGIQEETQRMLKEFEEKYCIQPTIDDALSDTEDVEDALTSDGPVDISVALQKARQITEDMLVKTAMVSFFESNFVFINTCAATFVATDNTRAISRSELRTMLSDFLVRMRMGALTSKSEAWRWFIREYLKLSTDELASRRKLHMRVILTRESTIYAIEKIKRELEEAE